ncbi:MAG TPA: hypothetical protein PKX92_04760 [Edaphocola sp.]|nr:hypothetical protein [Edaphocola sp.]
MKQHQLILLIFIIAAVMIAIIFYSIYRSSLREESESDSIKNPLRKRFYFFVVLSSLAIILLSVTLPKSPYFLFEKDVPDQVVYVAARQFSYVMSTKALDLESPKGMDEVDVLLNKVVEFRVTSLDVNHGFAIYNSRAELVTQVQAMPGYVNRLRWKFSEPGVYNILCLEFCGAGHAFMRGSFTVK